MTRTELLDIAIRAGARLAFVRNPSPGVIHLLVDAGEDASLVKSRIENAVALICPMTMKVDVIVNCTPFGEFRVVRPFKYPGECPCGISARACDYHRDLTV